MSHRNTLKQKAIRRAERAQRKLPTPAKAGWILRMPRSRRGDQ